MKTLWISSIMAMMLSACSLAPTQQQINGANFTDQLSSKDIAEYAREHMGLFDPYSAVISCSTGFKGYYYRMGSNDFGWVYQCTVNAKNRMGGYVGNKRFDVFSRYTMVTLMDDTMRYGILE